MSAMTDEEFEQRLLDARTLDQVRALSRTVKEHRDEAERWTDRARYRINQARMDRLLDKAELLMLQGDTVPEGEDAPEIEFPAGTPVPLPAEVDPESPVAPLPEAEEVSVDDQEAGSVGEPLEEVPATEKTENLPDYDREASDPGEEEKS